MQFRETLWFKKPPVEAERPADDDAPSNALRPIEDRYSDFDEPVTRVDSRVYGLHTGKTEALPKIFPEGTGGVVRVDEHVLADEFRRMRLVYGLAAVGVLVLTLLALLAMT